MPCVTAGYARVGAVCEYTNKEDIERVVQEECKSRFTLAHNAPIMKHLLAGKLRYLEDESIAKAIVDGTYEILPELDEATKYILREIGEMGRVIRKREGHEITFITEDFQMFWRKVSEWTTSASLYVSI